MFVPSLGLLLMICLAQRSRLGPGPAPSSKKVFLKAKSLDAFAAPPAVTAQQRVRHISCFLMILLLFFSAQPYPCDVVIKKKVVLF